MAASPESMPRAEPRRARRSRRPFATPESQRLRELIETAKVELIPMKSLDRAIDELRPGSSISMTCSPAKTIEATLDEAERLTALGHHVTPHISARMVQNPQHMASIRERLVDIGIREIFVVGGDAEVPGCFFDAIEFIEAFVALDDADGVDHRQVDHIGYTAYPDSHPFITNEQLHDALHAKQHLIVSTGRSAHVSTQMCFSAAQIRRWLAAERATGFSVPVHLGVPGVIDKAKLMSMGLRLGVGTSLRYLTKNRKAIGKLMTQRTFRPDSLLRPLAGDLDALGIEGIHLYTFNQVAATETWRTDALG